jgi:hypothetical protein
VLRLLGATLAAFALLALSDVLLVRYRHLARLRMTRQELKEEMKESDGDPLVKARMRQIRQSKGRRRMLAAVPQATVVITNPTHYAVALAYEPGQSAAPRIVAKGVDSMAGPHPRGRPGSRRADRAGSTPGACAAPAGGGHRNSGRALGCCGTHHCLRPASARPGVTADFPLFMGESP